VVGNTVPINLVAPGQVWGDRVNALDLRFAKVLRFGRTRSNVGIDLYNMFNANTGTVFNGTYGQLTTTGLANTAPWLRPTSILNARFVRFNATIDF